MKFNIFFSIFLFLIYYKNIVKSSLKKFFKNSTLQVITNSDSNATGGEGKLYIRY
jgi:hypothetical protein